MLLSNHLWQVKEIIFLNQGKNPFAVSSEEELGQNVVFRTTRELIGHLHRATDTERELPLPKHWDSAGF